MSRWTKARDPEAAGFDGYEDAVDIEPNDLPAKFLLLLQHPQTDDDCYAFWVGGFDGQRDGRFRQYPCTPGRYRIELKFTGVSIDQTVPLDLVHVGRTAPPELLGVPKKHHDAEPSFGSGPEMTSDDASDDSI